jgi:hypothetical protein
MQLSGGHPPGWGQRLSAGITGGGASSGGAHLATGSCCLPPGCCTSCIFCPFRWPLQTAAWPGAVVTSRLKVASAVGRSTHGSQARARRSEGATATQSPHHSTVASGEVLL